jgi:hypothetical protein
MIEINLLPEELKKKTPTAEQRYMQPNRLIYLLFVPAGLLISVHLYLTAAVLFKNYQYQALRAKWVRLEPERKRLGAIKEDYAIKSSDVKATQELIVRSVSWSEKLNKLSLYLPSGIWFNEIVISPKEFILNGSVISLTKEELTLINKFIDSFKKDPAFFKDFLSLELSTVQRRAIATYEVLDFTLSGKLK